MAEDLICSAKKKGRDLTVDSLKIAGKEPVREVIIITPKDVKKKSKGEQIFTLSYRVNNEGYLPSRDFENFTYFNDKVVSRQNGVSLGPNKSKVVNAEAAMDIKDGVLTVRIDALSRIQEDDETNNEISSMILFKGFQKGSPADPLLHIELLRIANKTPSHGRVKLQKREASGMKQGRVAFPVEFVIRNYGLTTARNFDNLFFLDGKRFFRQKGVTLEPGESKLVQFPVYFPVKNGKLTLRVDANEKYPKASGCNRSIEVRLFFQGFNRV